MVPATVARERCEDFVRVVHDEEVVEPLADAEDTVVEPIRIEEFYARLLFPRFDGRPGHFFFAASSF
ncbi:MAG: hypothetical protein ABWY78_06300 [Microvirga sp.]